MGPGPFRSPLQLPTQWAGTHAVGGGSFPCSRRVQPAVRSEEQAMTEEQTMILQMVQNGKLTPDEAQRLLAAINQSAPRPAAVEAPRRGPDPSRREEPRGRERSFDAGGARVNLAGAEMQGANLAGKNLSGVNLTGAKFSEANLSEANLSGANLSGAELNEADLSNSNLSDTNLTKADLSESNLS